MRNMENQSLQLAEDMLRFAGMDGYGIEPKGKDGKIFLSPIREKKFLKFGKSAVSGVPLT